MLNSGGGEQFKVGCCFNLLSQIRRQRVVFADRSRRFVPRRSNAASTRFSARGIVATVPDRSSKKRTLQSSFCSWTLM